MGVCQSLACDSSYEGESAMPVVTLFCGASSAPYLVATELGLVNDGKTDCSATLRNLATQGALEGRTVLFPGGTYLLGDADAGNNVRLVGEPSTVFRLAPGAKAVLSIKNRDRVTVEGIEFFGGGAANKPAAVGEENGVAMSNSWRVTLVDCYFRGFSKAGVYVTEQGASGDQRYYANLIIRGCRCEQNYYGIMLDVRAEYANVTGCACGQNRYGVFVGGGNNQFANCQFNVNTVGLREVGGKTDGVSYDNDSHNSFTGCQFNHNDTHSVVLDNAGTGIMFTGCQFFYGTMEFTGGTKGIVFSACEGGSWRHVSHQSGSVMYCNCFF